MGPHHQYQWLSVLNIVLFVARGQDLNKFTSCRAAPTSYGGSWLARMKFAQRVDFTRGAGRPLERDASYGMYHAAHQNALRFEEADAFYSIHLAPWLAYLRSNYRGSPYYPFDAMDRLEFAAAKECANWQRGVPISHRKEKIVALVPFHADNRTSSAEDENPGGEENNLAAAPTVRAMQVATLKVAICSMLPFVDRVRVFVMPDQVAALVPEFSSFIGVVDFVTFDPETASERCSHPRTLRFCALESLKSRKAIFRDFFKAYHYVYYSEAHVVARWKKGALEAALGKIDYEYDSHRNNTYFPPIRTYTGSCADPVNQTLLHVEDACASDGVNSDDFFPATHLRRSFHCPKDELTHLDDALHPEDDGGKPLDARPPSQPSFWWKNLPNADDLVQAQPDVLP
mmetsp:Transcript_1386/g.4738  ORF Transcript_1386/g.4738 Transcript_1386/m.4738 type:complete len:400 (+) Transcript_1386:265-1464(+)